MKNIFISPKKKYDTSILDRELKIERRKNMWEIIAQFWWKIYPLGCALLLFIIFAMFAIAIVLMMSEPSLNGTY